MPPKVRIIKEDIIDAAFELVRKEGVGALNARSVAASLKCSTQPIFSNFDTIEQLCDELIRKSYSYYLDYLDREAKDGKYPMYKAFGMAYIRFATEEKNLFRLLFMRDRGGEKPTQAPDFEKSIEIIMSANGISRERATRLHLEMWACVHGIATMLVTSFVRLEWELISDMLTDVYQGVRDRYLQEKN